MGINKSPNLLKNQIKTNVLQSTKTLISNCQKGDKQSQYLLVKKYSRMLLTVCRRYARDESMAKDALQETFIRIFSNIKKYKAKGSFEGWMTSIAVHASLKPFERKYYSNELPTNDFIEKKWAEPDAYINLQKEEIIQQIQTLPDGYRAVLNLYVFEGFSHAEIAATLGISEHTSRSQLTRARKLLKKKLIDIPKKASA